MSAVTAVPSPVFVGLQAAIVDLDGTLVDTVGDFIVALNLSLGDLHLPPVDTPFVLRTVGKGSEHLIRSALSEVGGAASQYARTWARYQYHYERINGSHSRLFPGAEEGLQRLADLGLRLACVTNKPQAFADALLVRTRLTRHFAKVYGGDAFERMKPDPLPLLKTCAALGSTPATTLVIGDSSNDAKAARAAGCPVVLVTYGYNHGEPVRGVDADTFVDRIDAIEIG